MRNADRVTAVLLFVVSVAFAAGALKYYSWWGPGGPGSAFLPFWLGLAMAGLSGFQFVKSFKTAPPADWWPRGRGLRDMLVVLAATVVFVALLRTLGMVVGTALYLAFLVWFLGRHRWWVVLGVATGAAFFNWLVFVHWLRVPFPEGVLWIF
jgi:putative tricarboxylic transport membrane protein